MPERLCVALAFHQKELPVDRVRQPVEAVKRGRPALRLIPDKLVLAGPGDAETAPDRIAILIAIGDRQHLLIVSPRTFDRLEPEFAQEWDGQALGVGIGFQRDVLSGLRSGKMPRARSSSLMAFQSSPANECKITSLGSLSCG